MSSKIAELMEELDDRKRKYHEKLLSVDGEWTLLLRNLQVYDLVLDLSSLLIPEFYFASLSVALLFGFDLRDLEPLSLEFDWRFPDLEEWLRGVSVVIERVVPDYAVGLEDWLRANVKEEHLESILETGPRKGYYGRSRYGQAYYDPAAVREFLRNAVTLTLRKHAPLPQRRVALESASRALGIRWEVVGYLHDRMAMVVSAHTECFVLDYGLLNVSKLCRGVEHSGELGVVPYVGIDGVPREVEVLTLGDMQAGCILDTSLLNYCFLSPGEDIYVPDAPGVVAAVEEKLRRFRGRTMLTAPAFSNYVTGAEAADYRRCERTEVWGELTSIRNVVEAEVDATLRSLAPALDPFERRKYVSAVLQLLGHPGKRHRWGFRTFRLMEDPQLREWWVRYWVAQGLDKAILEDLYERVGVWLPAVLNRKVELGRRLRYERLGLPVG